MAKFKTGDKVIGNKLANKYGITTEGWIGTVTRVPSKTVIEVQDEDGSDFRVDAECFDLFGEETPREFKVGDRVKVNKIGLEAWGPLKTHNVDFGTVIVYINKDSIGIEFDKYFGGHDCGSGKSGHCWWLTDREIELVNVTVNLYENACWYCRKGGLVDLYLAGAMGICPSCGRVCNNTLPTKPKKESIVIEFKPKRENKPLTKAELEALPNGTKVYIVWRWDMQKNCKGKPRWDWSDWGVKDETGCRWGSRHHQCNKNYDRCFDAYLEEPERPF